MNRRDFLGAVLSAALLPHRPACSADSTAANEVITVTGPIAADKLGRTLPHEHVLVDFIGAEKASPDRYDRKQVHQAVLPYLKQVRAAGCQTFVDCTPAYLARDPLLLKQLSEATGLRILTNTGYYAAGKGKYLPKHAHDESADELAGRWLSEWTDGINGTKIRPGFIKIGVDGGPLSDVGRKLVQAAARTHLKSGLTIACHTGDGAAAMEEMEILREEGVGPTAWIWVHAQNEKDATLHERAAERGGWVEFDGVGPTTIDRHVELVMHMHKRGLLHRVLISQDAGWYNVGEPGGGKFRAYTSLFEQFLPALKKAGLSEKEIHRLCVTNPAAAFAVRVRQQPKSAGTR